MFWFLVVTAFATSALTAVIGLGGGVMLLTVMSLAGLSPLVLLPVHAFVQLVSNVSRAIFAARHIEWSRIPWYFFGVALGSWVATFIVVQIPEEFIFIGMGVTILVITWLPRERMPHVRDRGFSVIGAVQGLLATLFGVAGPLVAVTLKRDIRDPCRFVATSAVMMTGLHLFRVLSYSSMNLNLGDHRDLLLGLPPAAIAGSYFGNRLRTNFHPVWFWRVVHVALTLLACIPLGRGVLLSVAR